MADRLKSWEKRKLPSSFEKLAAAIADNKYVEISTATTASLASRLKVATSPDDREAITKRANELISIKYAKNGRKARS